jgi:hypothetical protein
MKDFLKMAIVLVCCIRAIGLNLAAPGLQALAATPETLGSAISEGIGQSSAVVGETGVESDELSRHAQHSGSRLVWQPHASLMSLGFLGLVWGVLAARFRRRSSWAKNHARIQIITMVILFCGLAAAIWMVEATGGGHLDSIHARVGLAALGLSLLTLLIGFLITSRNARKAVGSVKLAHRYTGWSVVVLLAFVIYLGLSILALIPRM